MRSPLSQAPCAHSSIPRHALFQSTGTSRLTHRNRQSVLPPDRCHFLRASARSASNLFLNPRARGATEPTRVGLCPRLAARCCALSHSARSASEARTVFASIQPSSRIRRSGSPSLNTNFGVSPFLKPHAYASASVKAVRTPISWASKCALSAGCSARTRRVRSSSPPPSFRASSAVAQWSGLWAIAGVPSRSQGSPGHRAKRRGGTAGAAKAVRSFTQSSGYQSVVEPYSPR